MKCIFHQSVGRRHIMQAVAGLLQGGLHCEYRIVGEGSFLEATAFARHQLGLDSVVKFMGKLDSRKVKDEYEWADVMLHAAVSEGFCNAVIEAQAMNLPVVTSDADGLPENVVNGVTGFVTPRREPDAQTSSLMAIAQNPELRIAMGKAGRDRVVSEFTLEKQIDRFEKFYRELLKAEPEREPLAEAKA